MKSLIIIILLVYAGMCLVLFLFQKSILYFPQPAIGVDDAESIRIDVGDLILSGWVVNPGQTKAVLYYGGNAEVIEQNIWQFRSLLPDHALYFIPYRGYGDNSGEPEEFKLYSDALAIYDHIRERHNSISVIGRSLGSGVATYVASEREIDKAVLITPYDSIVSVAKTHYPFFPVSVLVNQKFLSVERAPNIKSEVLILIAQNDQIIRPKHSETLAEAFKKSLLTKRSIEGASHNDISNFKEFEESMSQFFN